MTTYKPDLEASTAAAVRLVSDSAQIEERIVSEETVWRGKFLKAQHVEVALPDGRTSTRDIIRHPGAAAILAIDETGNVILVAQSRTAFEEVLLELPAGKLDPGEDPATSAARELLEETGVEAGTLVHMTSAATSAGFCDEVIYIYLATDLARGTQKLDEDEFVSIVRIPFHQVLEMIEQKEIIDAKTIMGVLLYKEFYRDRS